MSWMDVDVENIPDAFTAANTECRLTVAKAEAVPEKFGLKMFLSISECENDFALNDVFHWVSYPKPDDDDSKANFKRRMIKEFYQAFGITEVDPEDVSGLIGLSTMAVLGLDDDPEHGKRNKVKKWLEAGA